MAPYADYTYYTEVYGGAMPETDFDRLARRASAYLDGVTFGRIQAEMPEVILTKVKDACCAVADAYALNEKGGGIAAEENDGVRVSYVAGVSKAKTDNERLCEAALLYLGNTGLLYRGCGLC